MARRATPWSAGIRLKSGETLEADIIVTATGLNIVMLSEPDTIPIIVDGKWIDFSKVRPSVLY